MSPRRVGPRWRAAAERIERRAATDLRPARFSAEWRNVENRYSRRWLPTKILYRKLHKASTGAKALPPHHVPPPPTKYAKQPVQRKATGTVPTPRRPTHNVAQPMRPNDGGLRRRFPAPEPERVPEREYNGPPLRDKINAYIADMQQRPGHYQKMGATAVLNLILTKLGFNLASAVWGLISNADLWGTVTRLLNYASQGDRQNAAAEGGRLASALGSALETSLGIHGTLSTVTSGAGYAAGAMRTKLKKD